MKRILFLTLILILGLILSQIVPLVAGELPSAVLFLRHFVTMMLLTYIMIQVGREFEIDLKNKRQYIIDYGVAATAATFPWLFVTSYFLLFLMPENPSSDRSPWIEALLVGRFAAPTSAGVLFSMLVAAGLSGTWAYQKTRILAIFDDLDTVLLMIPLKVLMVGYVWQMGGLTISLILLLIFGWNYYRKLQWPTTWPWILSYSFVVTLFSDLILFLSKDPDTEIGIHIEVLLPAFILGCTLKPHVGERTPLPGRKMSRIDSEERVGFFVSSAFMFLVGFSMPAAFGSGSQIAMTMSSWVFILHVMAVTLISNIGKMFAFFCYKSEATAKERLAVAVSLFPRGEVGAGILAVSLNYGVNGPFIAVAFMSLALNLILTGLFVFIVKRLLANSPVRSEPILI